MSTWVCLLNVDCNETKGRPAAQPVWYNQLTSGGAWTGPADPTGTNAMVNGDIVYFLSKLASIPAGKSVLLQRMIFSCGKYMADATNPAVRATPFNNSDNSTVLCGVVRNGADGVWPTPYTPDTGYQGIGPLTVLKEGTGIAKYEFSIAVSYYDSPITVARQYGVDPELDVNNGA